jgi:hypothetical protein
MTEYSGRTTCYEHKKGDGWKETPGAGNDCIQQVTVFEVQWSNCPVEVCEEVRELWKEYGYGNDHYYHWWDDSESERDENGVSEASECYPIIADYLRSRNVTKCLIHWWW